jgi:hypothetical protein
VTTETIEPNDTKILDRLKTGATKATSFAFNLMKQCGQYALDNPHDALIIFGAVLLMDMEDSLDAIEENTEVSAVVDASTYQQYL